MFGRRIGKFEGIVLFMICSVIVWILFFVLEFWVNEGGSRVFRFIVFW